MKRILCAAVIAAFAAMPLQASTLFAFTCVVGEESGGDAILLELYVDRPRGNYSRPSELDRGQGVEWVELNRTTAIYDADTRVLLMLFDGGKAMVPDPSGSWSEADCSPGALRYFEIVEGP